MWKRWFHASIDAVSATGRLARGIGIASLFVAAPAWSQSEASSAVRGGAVPVADHHVHLVSPMAAADSVPPLPAAVPVPRDIAALLAARASAVGDQAAMARLFAKPARVLHPLYPIWLTGDEALETVVFTPKNYRLVPSFVSVRGNSAFIAGTWVKGSGATAKHITNFFLYAEKAGRAGWKIVAEGFSAKGPPLPQIVTAERLIGELDSAGIQRATILSLGYQVAVRPGDGDDSEYARVRAENDWVIAEAAKYPGRLVPFCGINPLKSYAIREVTRCAAIRSVRGIKLHFGNSEVDLRDPAQLAQVERLFRASDKGQLAIVVHLKNARPDYGAIDARIFIDKLASLAISVPVQIAHLAGAGPGLDADDALAVFAEAAEKGDPRMKNIWFDVASTVTNQSSVAALALVARRIRQIGPARIVFGSDRSASNDPPLAAWEAFKRLPLSAAEFQTIARNVAPYMTR